MNLYVFGKIEFHCTEIVHVVAENEEQAQSVLKNDGRYEFELECSYPLSPIFNIDDTGIPYSLSVED